MLDISSYTSHTPTSNMDDIPSSSSSSSSTFVAGGRTLDRHNPIITDEKRSGFSSDPSTPLGTPRTNHILQQKPKSPFFTPSPLQHKNKKSSPLLKMTKNTTKNVIQHNNEDVSNRVGYNNDLCGPSELVTKAVECNTSKPNVGYVSPPESSRYLLDDEDDTSFLDALSGFGPGLKSDPKNDDSNRVEVLSENDGLGKPSKDCSNNSSGSSDQVVVLRVSLHCRGCERKMKKHLSKMSGVTSFNVDFVAKQVTVVGDVTPLQVLANISKVKTAKLWSPAMPSYSNIDSINTNAKI